MDVRAVAAALGTVLLSGVLAGCGSTDDRIRSSTADDLHRQVDAVRQAVADERNPAAESAVAELKATIRRLSGSGELDPADGVILLTQVDRIAARVEDGAAPTPSPTPVPATGPPESGKDKGPGKAKGKKK